MPPLLGTISGIARATVWDWFGSQVWGKTQVIGILTAQNAWERNTSALRAFTWEGRASTEQSRWPWWGWCALQNRYSPSLYSASISFKKQPEAEIQAKVDHVSLHCWVVSPSPGNYFCYIKTTSHSQMHHLRSLRLHARILELIGSSRMGMDGVGCSLEIFMCIYIHYFRESESSVLRLKFTIETP